jgi:hypothetical protein
VLLWLSLGAALFVLLLFVVVRVPVSLSSNVQAKAEPSGAWAVAVGLGLGPFAVSAIAAARVKPFLTCHVFGRQLARVPLSRWLRRRPRPVSTELESEPPAEAEKHAPLSRLERGVASLFRSLDPIDAVLTFLWEKERVFQVRSVVIEVEYSFRDVALTGRILAALYVLSALLPEQYEVRQAPRWESEDRVGFGADGRFKIWPGRLLLDVARFVLKQRSQARQSAALAKRAAQST